MLRNLLETFFGKRSSRQDKETAPRLRKLQWARVSLEQLEGREVLSGSVASSTLGGIAASFSLDNTTLSETRGPQVGIVATNVQGLYQGSNTAGQKVAYDWVNGILQEFSPTKGWVPLGAANQVVQTGNTMVLFTQGTMLNLATGIPGVSLPILPDVQSLTFSGGVAAVQIGSTFKANVGATLNVASGGATLSVTNVQMNIGQFAASFLGHAVTTLQSFARPLQPLADALEKPLIPGFGFTTTWLMQQLGYGQAASAAKKFADTIETIDSLSSSLQGQDTWVTLGSFTARETSPAHLVTQSSTLLTSAGAIDSLLGNVSSVLGQLRTSIPDLQVAIDDPRQLLKLITGETTTLFTYTLSLPNAISVARQQQLAAIPVSPVTLTEFDVYANLKVSVSAAATFGYDTSGFQTGNLANGFFIQNANLTASLTAGLSGLLNEADLAGYELTGAVTGSVTAGLQGANGSGKVYFSQISAGAIAISNGLHFNLSAQALPPQQMLGLAIQQFGPYLKTLLGTNAQVAASILNGNGVTPLQIAEALGTWYGVPPQTTAGILNKLGATASQIAGALNGAYQTTAARTAGILYGLGYHLNEIAGALFHGGVTYNLSSIANALWNMGVAGFHYGDIANALWNMGVAGIYLNDIGAALYRGGLTHNLASIANTLWNMGVPGFHYSDVASALWNMGISGFHLKDIAGALYNGGLTHDLGSIAGALWNMSATGMHYSDVANALWNMGVGGLHLKDIAGALYNGGVTQDLAGIANALWNTGVAGFHYSDVANALWNMGVGGFHLSDIASALSRGGLTHNLASIAGALWNMGVPGFHLNDIAGALYNGGLTHNLGSIANALWNIGVGGFHYSDVANALWYMGVAGFHLNDIAGALYNGGLTRDLGSIANALWNMGVAGFHLNDIAAALWNMGVGGYHIDDIANALYDGITNDLNGIANAIWTMGVGGLHYSDIANALNSIPGTVAGDVSDALNNFWSAIGNGSSVFSNILGDIESVL